VVLEFFLHKYGWVDNGNFLVDNLPEHLGTRC
jgi:hypothetical protein